MFFTLPFKRSIAKTSHNQSQQKRRTSPRHSSLCLIQRAISSEWPALRASVFYYTRFGGSVKGVFMEGEEHLCFLCGRNSFILCLQIHNSCIGWNERFPPFFLLDRHSVFLAMVPDFPYMDLVARGNHSGPTCHLHGRMFHPPGSVIKSLLKEGRNSRKTAYKDNLWDVKPHSHSVPCLFSQLFSMLFGIIFRKNPPQFQWYFDLQRLRVLFVYLNFSCLTGIRASSIPLIGTI